jgi:hypothetical protein
MSTNNPDSNFFYEIEYNPSQPKQQAPTPQKISSGPKDEIRSLYYSMKDIARQYLAPYATYHRTFDGKSQYDNAKTFYNQAVFLKDFTDSFPEKTI